MHQAVVSASTLAPAGCPASDGDGEQPPAAWAAPPAWRAALPLLDDRGVTILYARCVRAPAVPVRVLANHFGVSASRVRQLEDGTLRHCLGIGQGTAPLLRQTAAQLRMLAAKGYLAPEQPLYVRLFGGTDPRLLSAHLTWLEEAAIRRTSARDPWEDTGLSVRARHTLFRAGRDPAGLRHCDRDALQGIPGIGPLLAAEIYQALHPGPAGATTGRDGRV